MVGLLLVLVREGEMPDDFKHEDYIHEGKIVVEDFNCYFNPQDHYTSKSLFMRKYRPVLSNEKFVSNKVAENE
jgi:hypothetical protein